MGNHQNQEMRLGTIKDDPLARATTIEARATKQ